MIIKHVLSGCFLFASILVMGQNDSIHIDKPDSFEIHKVLVIPFPENMYVSDADMFILEASKITYPAMVARFRASIGVAIRQQIPPWWESELLRADRDTSGEAAAIYASLKYKYAPLNEKHGAAKKSPISGKEKTEKEKPGIVKGEVRVEPATGSRYMSISQQTDTLLNYLSSKYKADFFVFVNMMEIKSDLSDYAKTHNNQYERELIFHYTILEKSGKVRFAGIAKNKFPSKENNTEAIITKYFGKPGSDIVNNLPPPQKAKKVKP